LATTSHAFQGDFKLCFQAGTPRGPATATLSHEVIESSCSSKVKAKTTEQIAEVDITKDIIGGTNRGALCLTRVKCGSFLRVGEDSVRLGNFFKSIFSAGFFIAVGMVFEGQFAKGALDRLIIGIAWNAKNRVVILVYRWHKTYPSLSFASRVADWHLDLMRLV